MHAVLPAPGDLVWIRQRRWRVEHVRRETGLVRLDVCGDGRRLTFLSPFDRPMLVTRRERPRRVRRQEARARLAGLMGKTFGWRSLASALTADVAILPHQLEPALAIAGGARRVLVADDVGLGKTIQAGLVIVEQLRIDPAARML